MKLNADLIYQVHFSLLDEELVVRTQKSGKTYELIPVSRLKEDFPIALIDEYSHWLDVDAATVQWRPHGQPWSDGPYDWTLSHKTKHIH